MFDRKQIEITALALAIWTLVLLVVAALLRVSWTMLLALGVSTLIFFCLWLVYRRPVPLAKTYAREVCPREPVVDFFTYNGRVDRSARSASRLGLQHTYPGELSIREAIRHRVAKVKPRSAPLGRL